MSDDLSNLFGSIKGLLEPLKDAAGAIKPVNDALDLLKKTRELFKSGKAPTTADAEAMSKLLSDMGVRLSEACEAEMALRSKLIEAMAQLQQLQEFEQARGDYWRVEIAPGSYAYLKPITVHEGGHKAGNPLYCVHCFEQTKRISTLQVKEFSVPYRTLVCHACKSEVFEEDSNGPKSPGAVVMSADFDVFKV